MCPMPMWHWIVQCTFFEVKLETFNMRASPLIENYPSPQW